MTDWTLTGASGQRYRFRLTTVIAELPEQPGLYAFARIDPGVLGITTPLFIGRAVSSIAARIHGHEKWHEARALGINAIGVLPCPELDRDELHAWELDLRQGCITPLNDPEPGPIAQAAAIGAARLG